jgi:uncharacterized membrane protein YozB (DUF420 family)
MTVAVSAPARRAIAAGAYDRVFYSGMAIAMAGTVFAGFAPTYYLRSWFGAPITVNGSATLSPLAHVHGALFTAWVLLFVVQTSLIARRRTNIHQRMGIAGSVLAAAMLIVGTTTAIASAARGGAPPGIDPLVFLFIPLSDMLLFALFVGGALWRRRDREAHKRLMLLGYIAIITAAVARLPGIIALGPLGFFGVSFLFLLAGITYDAVTRRRVHPVYIWGGALIVLSVPLRLMFAGSAAWRGIAEFLTR